MGSTVRRGIEFAPILKGSRSLLRFLEAVCRIDVGGGAAREVQHIHLAFFIESARDTPAFRYGEGVRLVLSGRYNYDGFPEGRERFK